MRYQGSPKFSHAQTDRIGVLITNLGTPDAAETPALRTYLREFLSDPRVVEVPRLLWWLILNGVILRIRPRRSAAAYKTVWTERGSPLLFHTKDQQQALQAKLAERYGDDVVVKYAMRYGNPSIASGLQELFDAGARKLVVLPLYPQYSAATTGSTFDAISTDFNKRRWLPDFRFVSHYHDHPAYIAAVAQSIKQFWETQGKPEKLILSYHGVPLRYLHEGDPYHCECHKTSRLIAEQLGLQKHEYITTFQSRFGREEWLQPYTDATLKALPGQGVKRIQVVCPGFSSDCLETIEEIGEENREYFMEAGGKDYAYIPALNAEPGHIDVLAQIVQEQLHGWTLEHTESERAERAKALGE
ncbi:ferrochelatase [Pseudidiomarina gelatinasegens]|uniref:Ferrochelatase n=1 Tax=Pseudidiomarina gelatinasegens TaxID=2487740 RepID=A0A443Z4H9_9GAMM|nr:ferrochelatase [Pseudidiomarina gelatinasegens]RWU11534.1 ferrochelatase [Pseudidiomarina gelatinasegens]